MFHHCSHFYFSLFNSLYNLIYTVIYLLSTVYFTFWQFRHNIFIWYPVGESNPSFQVENLASSPIDERDKNRSKWTSNELCNVHSRFAYASPHKQSTISNLQKSCSFPGSKCKCSILSWSIQARRHFKCLSYNRCLISSKLEIRNNTGVHSNLSLTSGWFTLLTHNHQNLKMPPVCSLARDQGAT